MSDIVNVDLRGVDLCDLLGRDVQLTRVAGSNGGEWAGPCPSCGGRDRFRVWPLAARPRYWCRQCKMGGDAIDYVRHKYRLTYVDACHFLGVRPSPDFTAKLNRAACVEPSRRAAPPLQPDRALPSATWMSRAESLIEQSQAALWSQEGAAALAWLKQRGLRADTIRGWRLGFKAHDTYERPSVWGFSDDTRVWEPRGITIPWYLDGKLCQVKVRRAVRHQGDRMKYVVIKGGRSVLFAAPTLHHRRVSGRVESELDAILLDQECGDLIGVWTLGGATTPLTMSAAANLMHLSKILDLCDSDQAGESAAAKLATISSRTERLAVPKGKDVTEFVQGGGNLRKWIVSELERLGLDTPQSVDTGPVALRDLVDAGLTCRRFAPAPATKNASPDTRSTMSVDALLASLRQQTPDVNLMTRGTDEFWYYGPALAQDDLIADALAAHRAELIALFTYAPDGRCSIDKCYRLPAVGIDGRRCPDHANNLASIHQE